MSFRTIFLKNFTSEFCNGFIESRVECIPALRGDSLSISLGMHEDASGLSWCLGVCEDGDFAAASSASVRSKLKSEFTRVFCLNAVCYRSGMLIVASATAVLN